MLIHPTKDSHPPNPFRRRIACFAVALSVVAVGRTAAAVYHVPEDFPTI